MGRVRERTPLAYFSATPTLQSGVEIALVIVTGVMGIVLLAWALFELGRRPYWMPYELVRSIRFVMAALGMGWIVSAGTLIYWRRVRLKHPGPIGSHRRAISEEKSPSP